MKTTYQYYAPYDNEFDYDTNKVVFDNTKASLKKQYILSSDYTTDLDLEYNENDKPLAPISTSNVTATNGWAVFTDAAICNLEYHRDGNFAIQEGTIRFKYRPHYTGSPATDAPFAGMFNVNGSTDNMIWITHSSSGYIFLYFYDKTSVMHVALNAGMWNPTANQEYELELNYDLNAGDIYFLIDGALFYTDNTVVMSRDLNAVLLRLGNSQNKSAKAYYDIKDVQVFDRVMHITNYMPGKATLYTTDVQTISRLDTFRTDEMQDIQANMTEVSGIAEVRGILNKDLQDLWYNTVTDQFEPSNGKWEQSNTLQEFQDHYIGPTIPGNDFVKVLLKSYDGSVSPSISTLELVYSYSAPDIDKNFADIEVDPAQNPEDISNNMYITWELVSPDYKYKGTPITNKIGQFTYDETTKRLSTQLLDTDNMTAGSYYIFTYGNSNIIDRKLIPQTITGGIISDLPDYED